MGKENTVHVYMYTMESFPAIKKNEITLPAEKNGWNWNPVHHVNQNNSDAENNILHVFSGLWILEFRWIDRFTHICDIEI